MIDLAWCDANAGRILERDIRCWRCGHLSTRFGRQEWAQTCDLCGSAATGSCHSVG